MELFWTPEAKQDREHIYDYIEADNPAAALRLDELFAKNAEHLLAHPGLGRNGRVKGTRERVLHPNYILISDLAGGLTRQFLADTNPGVQLVRCRTQHRCHACVEYVQRRFTQLLSVRSLG